MEGLDTFEMLSEVLCTELLGRDFYMSCAANILNPRGRKMFESLARDEMEGFEKFTKVCNREFDDLYTGYMKLMTRVRDRGIFQQNIGGGRLDSYKDSIEILKKAIEDEEHCMEYYMQLAENMKRQSVQKYLVELAKTAKRHVSTLGIQLDSVTMTGEFQDVV